MQNKTHRVYLLIFTLFVSVTIALPNFPGRGSRDSYTRFGIAPVIGFYSLKTPHAISAKPRMSFSAFVKKEWSMDHRNQTFLSIGLEYFLHGVNFKSYYFNQDTLQLYDKSFGYNYHLYIHELNLPIQAKYTFNSTTNSLSTPYISIGYHLRYLAAASLKVDQDGVIQKSGYVDMKFKNPFLSSKINSFVGINFGFQSNKTRNSSTTFFVELSYRYGFSPYYFQENYSASSLYINSSHLSLNIGVGF